MPPLVLSVNARVRRHYTSLNSPSTVPSSSPPLGLIQYLRNFRRVFQMAPLWIAIGMFV
jgi:hypothetical protein